MLIIKIALSKEGAFLLEKDMHKIKKTKNGYDIELTRGDYFAATVDMTIDGETYTPEEGDVLRFAVKHNKLKSDGSDYMDQNPLIEITIPLDTRLLQIQESDTKELAFGEYAYDIQLTKNDSGEGRPDTFIKGILKLTEEVE